MHQIFAKQPDKQKVTIEVSNVIKDGGTVTVEFNLPLSDCVINGYQYSDGNGELDKEV